MSTRSHHSTASLLTRRAQLMRAEPTWEERLVFQALSGKRLGVVFRRQVPVPAARCIVDLLAPAQRLAVEVDGGYHRDRRHADARRDERLRRAGYRVLHIEAELVRRDLGAAVERIREALGR